MLEKPNRIIKNGQSRENGNIGYTRQTAKTNKTKNTTQKTKKDEHAHPAAFKVNNPWPFFIFIKKTSEKTGGAIKKAKNMRKASLIMHIT